MSDPVGSAIGMAGAGAVAAALAMAAIIVAGAVAAIVHVGLRVLSPRR
ncbi:hypothetical protein [Naasia aerilata]|uniref:Uncharacterized protein n=1 Tax=Naasia aerilata TaxID=1162966 RepID=A0ABM8GC17_9MICO|nr:hypothetical protein [Naasia aerilata]BDZ45793.1 hypothetical protein GCM10025866_17020 [Naasia aerilata]